MNFKNRLKHVFKETFLDLFKEESPTSPNNLEEALTEARNNTEKALDALASFTVSHLHLVEEQQKMEGDLTALNEALETALAENNDDQARAVLRKRQALQKEEENLTNRIAQSEQQQQSLKTQVETMKAQVIDIERRKLELQLRDRAADAIEQLNESGERIEQMHNYSGSAESEESTLQKETSNQVNQDRRNTIDTRLEKLIEDDEVEQELSRLKRERG